MKDRIERLIRYYSTTASQFADEIGVQRSNISHIISERNKPSLDLAQKILQRFKEINSEWLIMGRGEMLKQTSTHSLFSIPVEQKSDPQPEPIPPLESFILGESPGQSKITDSHGVVSEPRKIVSDFKQFTSTDVQKNGVSDNKKSEIEKIVIFYKDKSFESYIPKQLE